jgi:hypothetical protein
MISGFATPSGTQKTAGQFTELTYRPLGKTGLLVSEAGFGCYRVNIGVDDHALALEDALAGGVNLIDTSANYADGGSEQLVGDVLKKLIDTGRIHRDQVVVVSKGGYLQGSNYALSQQRKADGQPFQDLVEYADGLEHCIHPDFLNDQIGRSLERLDLKTLDVYLLHNPEYYLGWAAKQGHDPIRARDEYYRRIEQAFTYLETEVKQGRIRFYGVSSNTLPAATADPEFTSLHRLWEIARTVDADHRFAVIQLPFNLFETGAALEPNQPDRKTVLDVVRDQRIGLLINRPLNAFTASRMVRLAGIDVRGRQDYKSIIHCIKALAQSETRLWRRLLPGVEAIPGGIKIRIKQQVCFAETLKHHWRSFGSYERFRQAKDGIFLPRIQGVTDFLRQHADSHPDLDDWIRSHEQVVDRALRAVGSIYAEEAVALEKKILDMLAQADDFWGQPGSLSQKAIRALRSTAGVSTVLVGMRKPAYVGDVLEELRRPGHAADRTESWQRLTGLASRLMDN